MSKQTFKVEFELEVESVKGPYAQDVIRDNLISMGYSLGHLGVSFKKLSVVEVTVKTEEGKGQ